jgi:steroid delta-isomerase-like uncharacterized protein
MAVTKPNVVHTMTTREKHEAIVRRGVELFNSGDLDAFDEVYAPNIVDHMPFPGQAQGLEGVKQANVIFRTAFPDIEFTIKDVIAEGDKVVVRSLYTGTHKGALFGIPPTGKAISVTGICIARIKAGKIVDWWHNRDELGMMQQLGVIPPFPPKFNESG